MKTDREYQQRAFQMIRDSIKRGNRRILAVSPTGSGKGYVSARIMQMADEKGKSAAFFADQRELVTQLSAQLEDLRVPHGVLLSGKRRELGSYEDHSATVNVVSKDTLWSRAFRTNKMSIPPADVVQFDEAHRSLARTWEALARAYSNAVIIGFTATPCRSDNRGLGEFYDDLIVLATYEELQRDGHLLPVRVWAPDRPDLRGLKAARGDYNKKSLEERMNRDQMVGDIVKQWIERAEDRQTVAFLSGVAHSIHVRNEFRKAGIPAEHIDSKNVDESEREDILGRVNDGKVRVLCNYGIASTGWDVPAWNYLICARPTKSFSLWRQMGGRIQRPYPGHDHCVIQDHSDNALVYGHPDEDVEWSLDVEDKQNLRPRKPKGEPEGKPKDPYQCQNENCKEVYRGPHCPACGHRPPPKTEAVTMTAGELKELERQKANKAATHQDKQKFWDECLGWAIGTKRKVGAAAHRYKDKFGVWPNTQLENVPRSSQWKMQANDFYDRVVKPEKEAAKAEYAEPEF